MSEEKKTRFKDLSLFLKVAVLGGFIAFWMYVGVIISVIV